MRTVLYMHTGSGNHGCEALVRTTARLAADSLGHPVTLWTHTAEEEYRYGTDKAVDSLAVTDAMDKKRPAFWFSYFKFRILGQKDALHKGFIKELFKDSVAISIGGDNYCYPWSAKQAVGLDKELRRFCKKNVLWGCSIDEEAFETPGVEDDLKGFDLITVREPLSLAVLKNHGINAVEVADPAFLLEKKELPLPAGFRENNTVGINVSPLINDYESRGSIAFNNYVRLIEYILENTDMSVCLIPHVVWEYNNDRTPLTELFEKFSGNDRVIMLEDHDCRELKGFIARCRFFVGARTHATIAAYSSCVPTLVVGYSIKSKGIATDIFGTDENYVVPVQDMREENQLTEAFKFIENNEKAIKARLDAVIPQYKEKAASAGEFLAKIAEV